MTAATDRPVSPAGQAWLGAAWVSGEVFDLRPDYRAALLLVEGLQPGPPDTGSDALLGSAEAAATAAAPGHPHVDAWRQAFRDFGAKPQRTRPSVDALLRRSAAGLPRVDRVTDTYNALSVSRVVPVGGEDVDAYRGPLRLVRATGDEPFETTRDGEAVVEHPEPGEVVWRDDDGVTCRRWNWRQCTRTRITGSTVRAVFVLDALAPMDDQALDAAVAALAADLLAGSPAAAVALRVVRPH